MAHDDTSGVEDEYWEITRICADLDRFNVSPAEVLAHELSAAAYDLLHTPGVNPDGAIFTISMSDIEGLERRFLVSGTAPKYPLVPDTIEGWRRE